MLSEYRDPIHPLWPENSRSPLTCSAYRGTQTQFVLLSLKKKKRIIGIKYLLGTSNALGTVLRDLRVRVCSSQEPWGSEASGTGGTCGVRAAPPEAAVLWAFHRRGACQAPKRKTPLFMNCFLIDTWFSFLCSYLLQCLLFILLLLFLLESSWSWSDSGQLSSDWACLALLRILKNARFVPFPFTLYT